MALKSADETIKLWPATVTWRGDRGALREILLRVAP
jgi:hypothetical protein